jgi:hypothetical protein
MTDKSRMPASAGCPVRERLCGRDCPVRDRHTTTGIGYTADLVYRTNRRTRGGNIWTVVTATFARSGRGVPQRADELVEAAFFVLLGIVTAPSPGVLKQCRPGESGDYLGSLHLR